MASDPWDGGPAGDVDSRSRALESFADWSNYLLVTTVAALGWVAEFPIASAPIPVVGIPLRPIYVWCFGISIIFGIFTLALIPLVRQQMTHRHESIYRVPATFSLFGRHPAMYLTQCCRPQHISFIAGVVLYSADAAGLSEKRLLGGALALFSFGILGWFSRPRINTDDA